MGGRDDHCLTTFFREQGAQRLWPLLEGKKADSSLFQIGLCLNVPAGITTTTNFSLFSNEPLCTINIRSFGPV